MTITPDTKDWTWVLDRPCAECGFVAASVDPTAAPSWIREAAGTFAAVLDRPGAAVRVETDRWSDLEYVCHVRDVYRVYDLRLELMLTEDDPLFPNWDQDASAVAERYIEQDPTVVREELLAAAEAIARRYEGIAGAEWDRPGRRSDGARFTIATMTRYLLHDPYHHLHDVGAS
jgi:hypothetical protein